MPVRRSSEVPVRTPSVTSSTSTPSSPVPPARGPDGQVSQFTAVSASATQAKLTVIRALLAGHTDRKEEKQLLALFRDASSGELNGLLNAMSPKELHTLIADLDDRLLGPDNRTAFVQLLSHDRVADLGVDARAKLVQALQYQSTDSLDERGITNVFLATRGEALTALKNAIDGGGDYRDLQQLVFHDIDSSGLRAQLLEHFQREATPKDGKVKVLSDIDDTFYLNWTDDRFPKKTIYPGVRALYAELDRGPDAQKPDRLGDLMFVSARPYDRAGVSEHFSRATMHDAGVTSATVLSGDFASLIGNQRIADKKYENWEAVRVLYPEYGSVFLGDSGQGDALFGARAAAAQGDMRAVFIHNVTNLDAAGKAEWAAKGVVVFDTYVGAAVEAFKRGLISKPGLARVVSEASRELAEVPFTSPAQRAARQAELDADVAAARALL